MASWKRRYQVLCTAEAAMEIRTAAATVEIQQQQQQWRYSTSSSSSSSFGSGLSVPESTINTSIETWAYHTACETGALA